MKNKKLLSTILAATLAATTMAMPVMAADLEGNVPVDLGVKSGVIRVQLPTRMAIEIDQYELDNTGKETNQISSVPFTMTNKGNVNVKVDVTSEVKLGSGVKLATTKAGAVKSGDAYAWLAVAAATNLSGDVIYDDPTTSGDATKVEDYSQLKESNVNVATFVSSGNVASGDVKQTYFLKAASGDANAITYKTYKSGDAVVDPFAKFERLDGEMTASGDVYKKLETSDVYVVSGDVVQKYARGTASDDVTFVAGQKAYVISGDASKTSKNETSEFFATGNELYVYGEGTEVLEGKAAFRYIGKLSEQKTWGKSDISEISINYTIEGVGASEYVEATKDGKCIQGLLAAQSYKEEEAHGHWADGSLWLAKDSSNGFSSSTLKVEVSDGGTTYTTLASDKYSLTNDNWVSTTWANITEALGGEPSGNAFIRVTDGTTRYTFENQ